MLKEYDKQRSTKLISKDVMPKEYAKQVQMDFNSLPNKKQTDKLLKEELPRPLRGIKWRKIDYKRELKEKLPFKKQRRKPLKLELKNKLKRLEPDRLPEKKLLELELKLLESLRLLLQF